MDKANHDAHPVAATRRRGRYSCVCRREVLVRGLIGLFFHFSSLRFLAVSGWLLVIGLYHFAPVCQSVNYGIANKDREYCHDSSGGKALLHFFMRFQFEFEIVTQVDECIRPCQK